MNILEPNIDDRTQIIFHQNAPIKISKGENMKSYATVISYISLILAGIYGLFGG